MSPIVNYTAIGTLTIVFLVGMYVLARRYRSTAARHFEVVAEPLELHRGEEVDAELTVHDLDELDGRLEVGLVCVERYDHPPAAGGDGSTAPERATAEHVAYERWLPAWRTDEPQSFAFRVPTDAPYSYEGECLSFAWRVAAREPERDREGGERRRPDLGAPLRFWPRRRDEAEPAQPEPEDELGLRLERERVAPGEVVRGSVVVESGEAGGVEVALRLHERSVECDVVAVELGDSAPQREQLPNRVAYRFAIELPPDALPSCPSPHGGLAWTVAVSGPSIEAGEVLSRPIEVVAAPEP